MSTDFDNVLSVAAATGKVGYVFLTDGKPYDWGVSLKASRSPRLAYKHVTEWIDYYRPQLLITERITSQSRKQEVSRALVNAIMKAAQDANIKWACADRVQTYQNKYVEAEVLVARFPELKAWLPKPRRLWESEPRRIIIFEALSMALSVVDK
jgi:hypothetical protein